MADSLLFDGVDDYRQFTRGLWAGTGAWTTAAIIKPEATTPTFSPIISATIGSSWGAPLRIVSNQVNIYIPPGFDAQAGPTIDGTWWLLATSRPAGASSVQRVHTYKYSTDTWTHANISGTAGNYTPNSDLQFMTGLDEALGGNLLMVGLWDSNLSDGAIEALETEWRAWFDSNPDVGIRFKSTSATVPFLGTSTQTFSTGATVDTGDAPTTWVDGDPSAAVVDNFNRGSLGIGLNWELPFDSENPLSINGSTRLTGGGSGMTNSYYALSYDRPLEAYITYVSGIDVNSSFAIQAFNDPSIDKDGYGLNVSSTTVTLSEYSNAVPTSLGSYTTTVANGTKYALVLTATHVEAWEDNGTGWNLRIRAAEAVWTSTFYVTIEILDPLGGTPILLDDLSIQELGGPPPDPPDPAPRFQPTMIGGRW